MSNDGTGVPSFQTFAQSAGLTPRRKGCHLAVLDPEIRAQVEAAWAKGYRSKAVNAYLRAVGADPIPDSRLQQHFEASHACA